MTVQIERIVKVWWMMIPNRQRKSKKIHWLQDFVKSMIDDSIPATIPEEQIPFPQNNYSPSENCRRTTPLMRQGYTNHKNHLKPLYVPDRPHYPLSVSDSAYETRIATHDNWRLQSQLPIDDVPMKDIGRHIDLQEVTPRHIDSQEATPRHIDLQEASLCHRDPQGFPPHYRDAQETSPSQIESTFLTFTRTNIYKVYQLLSRRFVVHGALSILFIFIAAGTFMVMVPLSYHKDLDVHVPFSFHTISVHKNDTALIEGQAATATAVTVDGYDPGGGRSYADVLTMPEAVHIPAADYGSLNHFFYGQCTYWANMRYHQVTGHWIPWLGNAYQWAYQAPAYGWTLSTTPNPHGTSIMVFSPYAQGSGAYGHVAVVEGVNNDGSVTTSNWNWGGNWATLTYRTFYPGPGVSFIWYPN